MSNGDDRLIGEIHGYVKEHTKQLDTLFEKLDDMPEKCSTGQKHGEDIVSMRRLMWKIALAVGALAAAGGHADKLVGLFN